MRQRIIVLLMLVPLVLCTTTAFASWGVEFQSKTVNAGDVGVTVGVKGYWNLAISSISIPVVARSVSGGAFWTGPLPYDTGGNGYWHPYAQGVTWSWLFPWAALLEEFNTKKPVAPCPTEGDVAYDAISPDHFLIASVGSGAAPPAEPAGRTFCTFSFTAGATGGTFEFDTACFTPTLTTLSIIDNAFPPVEHGPLGTNEAFFNKGIITISGGSPTPPVITCPADPTVEIGQLVDLAVTATDDGLPIAPLTMTAEDVPGFLGFTDNGDNSGSLTGTPGCGDPGQYTIRLIANDGELADTCFVIVTVNADTQDPVLTCGGDVTVGNTPGLCEAVVNLTGHSTATDNCPGVVVSYAPVSGSTFPKGTTLVTATATDAAGNTATCTFNVVVQDTEDPILTCGNDVTVGNTPGSCEAIVNLTGHSTATDNCPGVVVSYNPASGSTFPVGTTLVTATATDAAGNTATCTFNVIVEDTEDPAPNFPAELVVDADPGQCYATVVFDFTAADNCPGEITIAYNPSSGSTFDEGTTTTVEMTTTDAAGNSVTSFFDVTVNEVPPEFVADQASLTFNYIVGEAVPPAQNVNITNAGCGSSDFFVVDNLPAWLSVTPMVATAPAALAFTVQDLGSLAPGTYTFDVEVHESVPIALLGKQAPLYVAVTLNVIGQENIAPIIACPHDTTLYADQSVVLNVSATDLNGDAITLAVEDAGGGALPVQAAFVDNGDGTGTFSFIVWCADLGSRTLRFIANDGELADTCYTVLTIEDNTPPEVYCPSDESQLHYTAPGVCYATAEYDAYVTDNCTEEGNIIVTFDPPSGSQFDVGITQVTATATDESGNSSTCTFNVTVEDHQTPEVTCPGDITIDDGGSGTGAVVNFDIIVSDNCPDPEVTINYPSGSFFPTGTTEVTVDVSDAQGNATGCSFLVTVNPPATPVIILVDPNQAAQGDDLTVHITGLNTCFGEGSFTIVELTQGSATITGTNVVVSSPTELDVDFSIPGDAALGLYEVAVGESGGCGVVALPDGFTVLAGGPTEICGQVINVAGGGLPAHVSLWGALGGLMGSADADEFGYFCIPVDAGNYDVRVTLAGYCTEIVLGIPAPTEELQVVLETIPSPVVTPYVADYWSINATLYGGLLMVGDVITAYDPDGVLCGVAYVSAPGEYLIHVYGDEPATSPGMDEGAEDGDVITFMLNCECPLEGANLWMNHHSYNEDLAFECERIQEIPLCGDWTLISYNVVLADQTLENVLSSIDGQYERVISSLCDVGAVTWAAGRPAELNDLTEMDNEHGYWLYAPGVDVLTITGPPIAADSPIALCDGWNVISYLPNMLDDLTHALGSIAGDYEYVIGFDCEYGVQTYDPARPEFLNDLVCLHQGAGYWIKMVNPATLTYPISGYACIGTTTILPRPVNLTRHVTPTPWSCDFWSVGNPGGAEAGAIITVRDEDGTVCGQSVALADGAFLVHVYGDDPATPADEGATMGSMLSFDIDGVTAEISGSDQWVERGSQEVTLHRPDSAAQTPKTWVLNQNYPNPFNAETVISFALPTSSDWSIRIYDITGRLIDQLNGRAEAGLVSVNWQAVNVPSGIYFYRLSAGEFTEARKMTLMK
jgi:hypothetical protein